MSYNSQDKEIISSHQNKIILKRKAEEDTSPPCYCGLTRKEQFMFTCEECKRCVHIGCLKSERPSPLLGDIYFKFICENCSPNFQESFERVNLTWTFVLLIALYNLHVQASSNCGYFKWRTQICAFIEKNWAIFFGISRKKSSTWPGTVAGTLSSNSPQLFKSGTHELRQPGWWALASSTLPSLDELLETQKKSKPPARKKAAEPSLLLDETVGLRHRTSKSSIQAAIELKEKRSKLTEAKEIRQSRFQAQVEKVICKNEVIDHSEIGECSTQGSEHCNSWEPLLFQPIKQEVEETVETLEEEYISTSPIIVEECVEEVVKSEPKDQCHFEYMTSLQDQPVEQILPQLVTGDVNGEECDDDILDCQDIGLNIDVETEGGHFLQEQTLETADLLSFNVVDVGSEGENGNSDSDGSCSSGSVRAYSETRKKSRKKKKEKSCLSEPTVPKYIFMTEYDEHQLLKRLEKMSCAVENNFAAKRLRRKLLVRQKQREKNKPLFDLDEQFRILTGVSAQQQEPCVASRFLKSAACPLDRYQLVSRSAQGRTHQSFVTRLMGFEDEQLESVISPYTMRTLKPFIFRDYESTPLKMKLLHDIQHYHNGKDPCWVKPKRYPLDFCYVRPNHIPVINNLCQDFFWPGIELSECLQYPDFSCVVLYRKVIVGFAFMVPDVKYNEVYISFVFTHPEWRNAGIATFMIYHLIQTCMGKDVTLHVSVTNPALFLYQKFGFKVEELILDFYDKYLPVRSKECRHALFLRLSR